MTSQPPAPCGGSTALPGTRRLWAESTLRWPRRPTQPIQNPTHDVIAARAAELEDLTAIGGRLLRPVDIQATLRAIETRAYRGLIDAETGCGLDAADALDGPQYKNRAEHFRQPIDRLLENLARR